MTQWMSDPWKEALADAQGRLAQLDSAVQQWEKRWASRANPVDPALASEDPDDYFLRSAYKAQIAHSNILLDLRDFHNGQRFVPYEDDCKPAYALTYEELQDRLGRWIVEIVAYGWKTTSLNPSQRLLLGWCGQLLAAPNDSIRVYTEDYLGAARSIYACAVHPGLGDDVSRVGRDAPDMQLLLALSAFPFLEGLVRRRLKRFLEPTGEVKEEFEVPGRSQPYRPPGRCSSLRDELRLLEMVETETGGDLGKRLVGLRKEVATTGTSTITKSALKSASSTDLYSIIFDHRNSNLHGGRHVVNIGLVALLLSTIVVLDDISSEFDKYGSLARTVVLTRAPKSASGPWVHYDYYPVDLSDISDPENPHRWIRR